MTSATRAADPGGYGLGRALAALCDQLSQACARYPRTGLVLRYDVKPHPGTAYSFSLCRESWSQEMRRRRRRSQPAAPGSRPWRWHTDLTSRPAQPDPLATLARPIGSAPSGS